MASRAIARVRGTLLRLVQARGPAVLVGTACIAVAATLWLFEFPWESWVSDGVGMVVGASGMALVAAAVGGRRPDWIEPE